MEPTQNENQTNLTPVPIVLESQITTPIPIVLESVVTTPVNTPTVKIKTVVEEKKEIEETKRLKPAEELFCQLYARSGDTFNNATRSYAIAYDGEPLEEYSECLKDKEKLSKYTYTKTKAAQLVSKMYIRERISNILREDLCDEKIDEELSWVAKQRKDLGSKMRAINEHNKLQGRIEEKIKHSFENDNIIAPEQLEQLLTRKEQKKQPVLGELTTNGTDTNTTK